LCAHSTRCSSLASDRRRRCALAVHIGRLFRSCHRAGRSYKSRCARCALMVLDALLWRRTAAAAVVSSRRPHRTFIPLNDRTKRDALIARSWYSMPFFGVGPPPLCALAVHIGRLCRRSRHGAGRSFKTRRALCALTVLDALLWRRTAAAVCSRRPHRTFVPLSPSGRAIVQVETRSLCAHGARCPSLASDRRRFVLSPST
jgi:hypothetical protein